MRFDCWDDFIPVSRESDPRVINKRKEGQSAEIKLQAILCIELVVFSRMYSSYLTVIILRKEKSKEIYQKLV